MKHILHTISLLSVVLLFILPSCGKIEGTFYHIDEVKPYYTDTTITTFEMKSSYGYTELFRKVNSSQHHYFMEWGTDGDAFGEMYNIQYTSLLNGIDYTFCFWGETDNDTELMLSWNANQYFYYSFKDDAFGEYSKAKMLFLDTLIVANVSYSPVLAFDFTAISESIYDDTPLILYFAGQAGLIKFVKKDGESFERVPIVE